MLDGKGGTSAGIYVGGSDLFPKIETYIIFCDAGFRPGSRDPFVSAKGPKTIDAPSGLIRLVGRRPWMRAGQLAALKQGPPIY